jgi:RNA recognition motif-containing protein
VSFYLNYSFLAFGFCEYENPEGTLRCIRLLNGWQIQDKKLVVSENIFFNSFPSIIKN